MDKLIKILEIENIKLIFLDLPTYLKGIFVSSNKEKFIILSNTLPDNQHLRVTLAHELGHYFTCLGDCVSLSCTTHTCRFFATLNEAKADRWAAKFLIPREELLECMRKEMPFYELVQYFQVTPELLKIRVGMSDVSTY